MLVKGLPLDIVEKIQLYFWPAYEVHFGMIKYEKFEKLTRRKVKTQAQTQKGRQAKVTLCALSRKEC